MQLQAYTTIAAELNTGNPALSKTAEAVNPPSGHSFPYPWDGSELTLLSIFDHYLGQVLFLLLLAQPADKSYLWETVLLNMRKHQHGPLAVSVLTGRY